MRAQTPGFKNLGVKDGLPSSENYCVAQDAKGYIWFSSDRGICKYNGSTFQTFSNAEGLPDNTIFRLIPAVDGKVWFVTYSEKLGYIEKDKVFLYRYNDTIRRYITSNIISNVVLDSNHNLWLNWVVSSNAKLACIHPDGRFDTTMSGHEPGIRKIYVYDNNDCLTVGKLQSEHVEVYTLSGQRLIGRLTSRRAPWNASVWCKTIGDKIFLCINDEVFVHDKDEWKRIISSERNILAFLIDTQGNIWLGYRNNGLEIYSSQTGYKENRRCLQKYSISSLYQDRAGGYWMCTLENGIYYEPPFSPLSYTVENGLSVPKVVRIMKMENHVLAILSDYSMAIVDERNKLDTIKNNRNFPSEMVYVPPDKIFYSGQKINLVRFRKQKIYLEPNAGKIFPSRWSIWHSSGSWLLRFNHKGKLIDTLDFNGYSLVKCLLETGPDLLLLGTLDGLYEYHKGKVRFLGTNSLLSHRISDIKRMDSSHLLVATMGYGMMVVNESDYHVVARLTVGDGLPSVMCHVLQGEGDSVVWVGTNKGLCRISHILSKTQRSCKTMDINDGLATNEINALEIIDHDLWVGTMNGMSIVPLNSGWIHQKYDVPVYLEKVTVDGVAVDADKPLLLKHDQNELSFYFTGLDYQHKDKLQYRYRLSNVEGSWTYTTNPIIIYKSLAPGRYTFELQAVNAAGQLSHQHVFYSFEILSPFWNTWWFIGLGCLFAVAVIYFLVQARVRFVKRQARLRNELGAFKEKALRAQMNPHFIYNSLSSIQKFILKNEVMASVTLISKFSRLMRLTFSNTSIPLVSLKADMDALNLYAELENLRFNNRFNFELHISPAIDAEAVKVPPLIIQPFVENAILHGLVTKKGKGSIQVRIDKKDHCIFIKIQDNGIGREQAAAIKSRKDKYQNTDRTTESQASSGISVTRARIEQMWGRNVGKSQFKIIDLYEGQEAAGTLVEFFLPIA